MKTKTLKRYHKSLFWVIVLALWFILIYTLSTPRAYAEDGNAEWTILEWNAQIKIDNFYYVSVIRKDKISVAFVNLCMDRHTNNEVTSYIAASRCVESLVKERRTTRSVYLNM